MLRIRVCERKKMVQHQNEHDIVVIIVNEEKFQRLLSGGLWISAEGLETIKKKFFKLI